MIPLRLLITTSWDFVEYCKEGPGKLSLGKNALGVIDSLILSLLQPTYYTQTFGLADRYILASGIMTAF